MLNTVANPLAGFAVADLHAELTRRAEAEQIEQRRQLNLTWQRTRLAGAVASARMHLTRAEDEHAAQAARHAGYKRTPGAEAESIRIYEIRVEQANAARVEAKDRLIAAERAFEAFEREEV